MSNEWLDLDEFIREELTKDFERDAKILELFPNVIETNSTVDFNDSQQVRRVEAMLMGKKLDEI